MADRLRHDEVVTRLESLPGWDEAGFALHAQYEAPDVTTAVAFIASVMALADEQGHHPAIDLRSTRVRLRLCSHDLGAHSERDVRLARTISEMAQTWEIPSVAGVPPRVEVGIDTADAAGIRPFWIAALGYGQDDAISLVDPDGLGPEVWFQVTDGASTGRNRLHVDVSVPVSEIDDRRAAVESAGGVEGTTSNPPSWWVYADADGNEVCLCTSAGRE